MKYLSLLAIFPLILCWQTMENTRGEAKKKEVSFELHHLVRKAKDATRSAPVLILLHGYGSNENDLFSLANQIPEDWLVVTVRAPYSIAKNQFKWYDVKLVKEKITMNFAKEEKSRKLLLQFIEVLEKKYKVDKNKIVTAGFSQGANMALGLALTEPNKILAAGCFSGRFMEEIKPLIQDKQALKGKQVFLSHGTQDKMLPLRYAEENKATLASWGINVTFTTDEVAHTISSQQFTDFINWMNTL
ncbi:MAG: alpha/beta hydrolase [Saprospiraceae bacterium]